MLTDTRFLWGVALGAIATWFLCGPPPERFMTSAPPTIPKAMRREGRLLRGSGQSKPAYWPFGHTKG